MTYPDRNNTLALLGDWQAQHAAVVTLLDGIESSPFGLDPNSPMFNTIWELFDALTVMLQKLVGDHGNWLEWHQAENEFGARGHEAGYDGNSKPVLTLDDLFDLVAESRKREVAP